jgi:hypothetical protein
MWWNNRSATMFIRARKRDDKVYLQIVENERQGEKVIQHVRANLGRLDILQSSGKLDSLLRSGLRFSKKLLVLDAHAKGECTETDTKKIGPVLLFEKLWKELCIKQTLDSLLRHRSFGFSVERAIFVTVVHRLICSGSDRAAEKWMQRYAWKEGDFSLALHQFYRAMAWLGTPLPQSQQVESTGLSPRCVKDDIEEQLYALRRTLFSGLSLVFLDTTSLYFEGEGGSSLGRRGKSKDGRSDAKQIVVAVVLDDEGNPVCCEIMPGNTADVTILVPIAQRLKRRFGIHRVCVVADRGMISKETIAELELMQWSYILGARMRRVVEVRDEVLSDDGEYTEIFDKREWSSDPAPLQAKEVIIEDRRYVVCRNEEEVLSDRQEREAIVAALREQLKQGDKSLVGNKGYRRYLKSGKEGFSIDDEKVAQDQRYDGIWVLRTNTDFGAWEVAVQYKQLWTVEEIFRTMKAIMETRPIFHHCDETIRGHVFCSFLALLLRKALHDKLEARQCKLEWADIIADIDAIEEVNVCHQEKNFIIRTETKGVAGKLFQIAGVALPPILREAESCPTTQKPCL